jgi:predicted nucleic acid-binding protein
VTIVCDSNILINFAAIDQLEILHQLYKELLIPNAVYAETIGSNFPDWQRLSKEVSAGWIEVQAITPSSTEHEVSIHLDEGEREAIILALELKCDRILLDEQEARLVAQGLGLQTLGTIGTFLLAKQKHLIPQVQPLLDALLDSAHYWVSADLYQQVLEKAGE